MSIINRIPKYLLGLIFVVFGLNFFLHFIATPAPTAAGLNFLTALGATGYFFPLLKACEIISGLMLLIGVCIPLALIILAPIILNIALYHIFLDPSGLPLALVMVGCFLLEARHYTYLLCKLCSVKCGGCGCGTENCTCVTDKHSCCK